MDQYSNFLKKVSVFILRFLMLILVAGMILGSVELAVNFVKTVLRPPMGLIEVHDLYAFMSLILIITVGYELLKSMIYVIDNTQIPVRAILKISMIAVANKVVTLDVHEASFATMSGIAVLLVALGLGYFLLHIKIGEVKDTDDLNE